MKSSKCLYCITSNKDGKDFHKKCSKQFFGTDTPPELNINLKDIKNLALKSLISRVTVPGVQTKISLGLERVNKYDRGRLTIVGVLGNYILKPPTSDYEFLPELESLTMNIADLFGIDTVPNSLIKLKSGEMAYITKRIDREKTNKFPMEDMAQLTGKLTEQKYRGSMEQIGKAIEKYSDNPGLDKIRFFEIVLFSFLTGNADMHLKNFSMINKNDMYKLTPAYDLLPTRLIIPQKLDNEESALTISGKKSRFKFDDFLIFSKRLGIPAKSFENIVHSFSEKIPEAKSLISDSFLNDRLKKEYIDLLSRRAQRIGLYA